MAAARAAALALVASLVAATPASAHGFYSTPTVEIPPWLLAAGSGLIVAVSFVAVAFLAPEMRISGGKQRELFGGPFLAALAEMLCGLVGVALLILVVYSGLRGVDEFDENFGTVLVFIIAWVGLAVASALFGDLFRLFNPWRAAGRAVGAVVASRSESALDVELPYPRGLGRLPAVAALLCFGFLELQGGTTPKDLAIATLLYSALMWAGMAIYGVERWTARGEGFGTYFNLFSRLAPFDARGGRVFLRRPLAGLAGYEPLLGTSLVLATVIGVVSFDGFSSSKQWESIQRRIVNAFDGPLGQQGAAKLSVAIGICVMTALIYGVYRLGIAAGAGADGPPPRQLARRLAPALVPIALAYTLAHYMQYLVIRGQAIFALISDPLGRGSNLFGTANYEPHTLISPSAYWYLEVGAIVVGHIAATLAAHDLALDIYGNPRDALRSQRWLVLIMVALSVFALWLLAHASEVPFSG